MSANGKLRHAEGGTVMFYCRGCDGVHGIPVEGEKAWGWNRSDTAPTFTPSILVHGWKSENPEFKGQPRCHSFVTDGRIQYLPDCEHALAGQTVDLPEAENWWQ